MCVFFFIFFLISGGVAFFEHSRDVSRTRYMEYQALKKAGMINDAILALLYKVEALSALVIEGNGEIREFERIAPIIANDPVIRNILLAPGGIVAKVYPRESNDALLGFDMFGAGAGNKEAIQARDSGRLTLGGPFQLMQGGHALVGRLPVFLGADPAKKLWGLVSVTLRYPEALNSVSFDGLSDHGLMFRIWRINPDTGKPQVIIKSANARENADEISEMKHAVERRFAILNTEWVISIAPLIRWYESGWIYFYAFCAVIGALVTAFICQNYFDMKKMRMDMELIAMRDPLTNISNRRSFISGMNDEIFSCSKDGTEFLIAYLDLNGFKQINDNYGHKAGDLVLIEMARRIRTHTGEEQLAARIGGDEFALLLRGMDSQESQAFLEKLCREISLPISIDSKLTISITVSIGAARYPTDGRTADALLTHADRLMYENKRRFYGNEGFSG